MAYLVAGLGGALGALARWAVTLVLPVAPGGLPWATLAVNLAGCLLIGVLLAVLPARFAHVLWLRPFLAVGVLGGFTTFSTFAVDVVRLGEAAAWPAAVAYLVTSVFGGVACVVAGLAVTRGLLHPRQAAAADLRAGEDRT